MTRRPGDSGNTAPDPQSEPVGVQEEATDPGPAVAADVETPPDVASVLSLPARLTETQNALAATGATGAFDAGGWTITLLTIVVIALLTAWACVACAQPFAAS